MKKKYLKRKYFIDPELQFWFVLILIFIVSTEGIFVGYGIFRLLAIASDWQRIHMATDFFITLSLILLFLIGTNFILGIYFSHKIAGPIFKLRGVLQEIKRGDLSHVIQIRHGDMLKSFVREFNETTMLLDKLVRRDKGLVKKALEQLDRCQEILTKKYSIKELKEIQKIFVGIKSYLVAVNSHFTSSCNILEKEKNSDEKENSSGR